MKINSGISLWVILFLAAGGFAAGAVFSHINYRLSWDGNSYSERLAAIVEDKEKTSEDWAAGAVLVYCHSQREIEKGHIRNRAVARTSATYSISRDEVHRMRGAVERHKPRAISPQALCKEVGYEFQ